MTEAKFSRYDSTDYLESQDDIAAYLDAAMAEAGDDPAYVIPALPPWQRSPALGLRITFAATQPPA